MTKGSRKKVPPLVVRLIAGPLRKSAFFWSLYYGQNTGKLYKFLRWMAKNAHPPPPKIRRKIINDCTLYYFHPLFCLRRRDISCLCQQMSRTKMYPIIEHVCIILIGCSGSRSDPLIKKQIRIRPFNKKNRSGSDPVGKGPDPDSTFLTWPDFIGSTSIFVLPNFSNGVSFPIIHFIL